MTARFFALVFAFTLLPHDAFPLKPEDEPVVKVVKKVRPTVVNIFTESVETRRARDPFDSFFEDFFGPGFSRGNRLIQRPVRNLGSGLLVSSKGFIVTNQHVVGRAGSKAKIKVVLADQEEYPASFVRDDPDLDLALIKIEREGRFPYLDLDKLSPNLLGQSVIAIGNPVGLASSISQGILSATDRTFQVEDTTYDSLIQTDAAINPGNSGGPLVDIEGNLVGINTAKASGDNIGFAIPADIVRVFAYDSIDIAEGRKKEPPKADLLAILQKSFGLSLQELSPELASEFGFHPLSGLLVAFAEPESPAARAGIQKGMLVVGIGPARVRTVEELPRNLAKIKKGESIKVTLRVNRRRGNFITTQTGSVVLEAR